MRFKKERRKGENFFRTGAYATRDEYKEIKKRQRVVSAAPVKRIPNHEELGFESTWKKQMMRELQEYVHSCALRHGLPQIVGLYGITEPNNMNDKAEFVCSLDVQETLDGEAPNKENFVHGGTAGGVANVDPAMAQRRYQYEMRKLENQRARAAENERLYGPTRRIIT